MGKKKKGKKNDDPKPIDWKGIVRSVRYQKQPIKKIILK